MATSEILPFAFGVGANVEDQAAYAADPLRTSGNVAGIAKSALNNKALLQSTLMSAALAKFIADNQLNNITDGDSFTDIATWLGQAVSTKAGVPTAVCGGTVDALTVDFPLNITITNGTTIVVRAAGANTSATPTIAVDANPAKTIVKQGNNPLIPGDIKGVGHWLVLSWDTAFDKWVLDNPATAPGAVGGGDNEIFYENDQIITQNYTLASDRNAISGGPLTIQVGVTVTQAPGSNWSIV